MQWWCLSLDHWSSLDGTDIHLIIPCLSSVLDCIEFPPFSFTHVFGCQPHSLSKNGSMRVIFTLYISEKFFILSSHLMACLSCTRKSKSKKIFFRSLKTLLYCMLTPSVGVTRLTPSWFLLIYTWPFFSFSLELVELFFHSILNFTIIFLCTGLFSSVVLSNWCVLSTCW